MSTPDKKQKTDIIPQRRLRQYTVTLPDGEVRTLTGYEPSETDFNRLVAEARQNNSSAQENFLLNIFQAEHKTELDALLDDYPMIDGAIAAHLLSQLGANDVFDEVPGDRRALVHGDYGVFAWKKPERKTVKEHYKKMQANALRGMKFFVFAVLTIPGVSPALESLLAEKPALIMPLYLAMSKNEGMGAEVAGKNV